MHSFLCSGYANDVKEIGDWSITGAGALALSGAFHFSLVFVNFNSCSAAVADDDDAVRRTTTVHPLL